MLESTGINYWAVLVAFIINMAIGAYWYSPAGFGKTWSKLTKIDMKNMSRANSAMGFTALAALVQSVFLALIVNSLNVTTFWHGLELGLVIWAGFVAATTISDTIFAQRGWKLWRLNTAYYLVVLLINASILAVWR